ncbi:MAG: hypothetical protein KF746_17340 [Chitinophagaceae bacterium]|nr:hypothetical protein [Chitinophagaceae bacterium]
MGSSKTILLLIVCSMCSSWAYTQNAWVDSLKKAALTQKEDTNKVWTLRNIADYYVYNDPDSCIMYARKALAIAEKLKYDSGMFWSIQSLHNGLHVTGNYTEQLNLAFKALPIAKRLNDLYSYGWSNGMMADSYINLGDYNSAKKYTSIVMKNIAEHFPDELYSGCAAIVPLYIGLHQYDSAILFARRGLQLLKAQPALYNSNGNDGKVAKGLVYLVLGEAFEVNNLYDSALYYYRESIALSLETDIEVGVVDAYNGIAHIFQEQRQQDSAIWYAKKVLADKFTRAYPAGRLKAADLLADVYEAQKTADSSLKYLRIAQNVKDSVYSREKTFAFQNALLKDQENQRAIEADTTALKNRYRLYFLITLFITFSIIAITTIRNRRIKQLQNIRNSIADDLHDDIGSTLSSISIMNELAKERSPEALQLLTSIGESTAAIQENMSDIVWTVNPRNDHFENLLQRMYLFATEITEAKNIQLTFNSDAALHNIKLTMKQRKNIYLFFKEAINNAAKHSGAKKIMVTVSRKESNIEMNITDDGKGFKTGESYNGNGMSSLKRRAEELNSVYNIASLTNQGTTIQLRFKPV